MNKTPTKQPSPWAGKRWKIILPAGLLLLAVYLLLANFLVMRLLPESERILPTPPPAGDNLSGTYGGIDSVIYTGGLTETLSVSGWCLSDNTAPNPDKRTRVYLVSETGSFYAPQGERSTRTDIANKLKKTRQIVGTEQGFAATFTTFPLSSGKYDIYLYNWENDTAWGYYKTGYSVLKDNTGLEVYQTKKVPNFTDAQDNSSVDFRTDTFTRNEGGYTMKGWARLVGANNDDCTFFAEFTKNDGTTITAELSTYSRAGIAELYNDGVFNYLNSGISLSLPLNTFAPGQYTVRVLAQHMGAMWRSTRYSLYLINEDFSITAAQVGEPPFDKASPAPIDPALLQNATPQKMDFFLQMLEPAQDGVRMLGWGVLPNDEPMDKIYIGMQEPGAPMVLYEAYSYLREGLPEAAGSNAAREFCAVLPLQELPSPQTQWHFFVQSEDTLLQNTNIYFANPHTFSFSTTPPADNPQGEPE